MLSILNSCSLKALINAIVNDVSSDQVPGFWLCVPLPIIPLTGFLLNFSLEANSTGTPNASPTAKPTIEAMITLFSIQYFSHLVLPIMTLTGFILLYFEHQVFPGILYLQLSQ